MVTEYKTTVSFLHSPFPYENEQKKKYKPSIFNGWFTIDELRKMNPAFKNKDVNWVPNVDLPYPDEVTLFHPYNGYYVLISESRIRS